MNKFRHRFSFFSPMVVMSSWRGSFPRVCPGPAFRKFCQCEMVILFGFFPFSNA